MRARKLNSEELVQYAVRALAAHARSIGELRQKMAARAAEVADVDAAIAKLKDLGYLDDKRFAENYASARLDSGGTGKARVVRDLRRKRVAPQLAERAVQKAYQNVDERRLIEDFIRRKLRPKGDERFLKDPKDMAAAYRRLLYAGFRSADIVEVLKRFAVQPELFEQFEPPAELESEE